VGPTYSYLKINGSSRTPWCPPPRFRLSRLPRNQIIVQPHGPGRLRLSLRRLRHFYAPIAHVKRPSTFSPFGLLRSERKVSVMIYCHFEGRQPFPKQFFKKCLGGGPGARRNGLSAVSEAQGQGLWTLAFASSWKKTGHFASAVWKFLSDFRVLL
jgi:hypothetical protein